LRAGKQRCWDHHQLDRELNCNKQQVSPGDPCTQHSCNRKKKLGVFYFLILHKLLTQRHPEGEVLVGRHSDFQVRIAPESSQASSSANLHPKEKLITGTTFKK